MMLVVPGRLAGHRNSKQKIQYVVELKRENVELRQQLAKLRVCKENRGCAAPGGTKPLGKPLAQTSNLTL